MTKKLKIAILSGGKSAEHEVSLVSAANILNAINKDKYDVIQLKISKKGSWFLEGVPVLFSQNYGDRKIIEMETGKVLSEIDVLFPVLHGPYGEDGTVQGLAKLAGIPFVGPGILASSAGMDKDVTKRLLRDAGISIAKFFTLRKSRPNEYTYESIVQELGNELFVKPANMGSSVGVSSAKDKKEFEIALKEAFLYDDKVIVEEKITGREIECAVLGNDFPKASIPGEIVPTKSFYSYESKYLDDNDARLDIPAKLEADIFPVIQDLAIKTYQCLECKGMTRVDMFLKPDNSLVINEINTIPGFTKISMYPALWSYSGIPQTELIDQLIQFAIEEFEHQNKLESSYTNSIKEHG
ncbi:MAG: D-alanine--D-alanine ligase [Bacteroidales bacterium]|nr:D-alanine--D-alanine ligase [Bacteroidales bacterium]